MLGLRTSPRRWQEHLSGKLTEHGLVQDLRDPCLFVNTELDICIGDKEFVAGTLERHDNAVGHGD